jgi:hypothetical protein
MKKKSPKIPKKYICEVCNYITSNKKDYTKHLTTRKHKILTNPNKNPNEKSPKIFECECGKKYKHISSLSFHKKNCKIGSVSNENFEKFEKISKISKNLENSENSENENMDIENLTDNLPNDMKDNIENDLKNIKNKDSVPMEMYVKLLEESNKMNKQRADELSELMPKIGNNNNNKFDIKIFLNEECKDALNIMDFIQNLNLQLCDLEKSGRLGYAGAITDILREGLNNIDLKKRPIHCSEKPQTIFYVKDNNVWGKDKTEIKLKKAIEYVGKNNFKQIHDWMSLNPDCADASSCKHEEYQNIVLNNISTNEEEIDKIIESIKEDLTVENDDK